MTKKIDGTHFLIMYLTGYAFYMYQVYSQLLYSFNGLSLIIPFCIAFLIMPITTFYICKKLNNRSQLEKKSHFVFTIIMLFYFFIVGIITINYASVMIHNYYYQSVQSYIIAVFLLIPIFYIAFKNSRIYYSLAFLLFVVYLLFKFLYIINHEVTDLYPLFNTLSINNPLQVIILALPIAIEPIILFSNVPHIEETKKINIKLVVSVAVLIGLIGVYTLIRETMEFGLLIEMISFPYFESCKFMSTKSNFENIDYYYLFSITIALFARMPMLLMILKDDFKLKTKGIITVFILAFITFYYLHKRLEFYRTIIIPTLIICSLILMFLLVMSLFSKRRDTSDTK